MTTYPTQKISILTLTEGLSWYKVGDTFSVLYDPYVGKFLVIGSGRYVLCEDCEIIE